MFIVLGVNLIRRRRSSWNKADAGLPPSSLQLHWMSSEIMSIGVGHVVFPMEDVAKLSRTPRAQRAAKYMIAMGLRRVRVLPTSSCISCMRCDYCFPRREPPVQ